MTKEIDEVYEDRNLLACAVGYDGYDREVKNERLRYWITETYSDI